MKYIAGLLLITILTACGGNKENPALKAKKDELAKLQQDAKTINEKIAKLVKEIAALDSNSEANDRTKLVAVMPVSSGSFQHYLEIQGKVDADDNALISAKLGGPVTAIYVKVGDMVSPGTVLAQLDDQQARQGMEELKKRMELALTVYQKQKALWDQKIGSEISFLTAKNNKEALEKTMATMQETLDGFRIRSGATGMVEEIFAKVGQMAAPGVPAFRVISTNKLKVKADIAETYAGKVRAGNKVLVAFPDINKETTTSISFTGKMINPMTRTFTIECPLEGDVQDYRPNMVSIVKIMDYENPNALSIPINTVQNGEEGSYVFVLKEEKGKSIATRKKIQTGMNYNGRIEVLNGLTAQDKLVTTGFQNLNEGEAVRVVQP